VTSSSSRAEIDALVTEKTRNESELERLHQWFSTCKLKTQYTTKKKKTKSLSLPHNKNSALWFEWKLRRL
jgi:hypothetical protein